jgi:broad specificity phosphatase PhoE
MFTRVTVSKACSVNSWDVVFLARPGQTQWNLAVAPAGSAGLAVDRKGVEQAQCHASVLQDRAIDGIFVSPIGRAVDTARIIGDALRVKVEVIDDLAELDHGEFSGLIDEQIEARFPGERQRRAADKYWWRFPGGESYAAADGRALAPLTR